MPEINCGDQMNLQGISITITSNIYDKCSEINVGPTTAKWMTSIYPPEARNKILGRQIAGKLSTETKQNLQLNASVPFQARE